MAEAIGERDGKTTTARRCFLSSLSLDPQLLAHADRAHRGIENRRHWALDVVFHDDLMRLRTENGLGNMATIKHMAMNLIREANGKESLKVRPAVHSSGEPSPGWFSDPPHSRTRGTFTGTAPIPV